MVSGSIAKTAEDVSGIAFGFMGSKALFAALHIDLFTLLSIGPRSVSEICEATNVPKNRITTLMTALVSIGLVSYDGEDKIFSNSPGAEAFLVQGAKHGFGDYLRNQVDKQMYPFLNQLNEVIDGSLDSDAVDSYQSWMSNVNEAQVYSKAQHAGSLGPGKTLSRLVDLSAATSLLDVGGGSGAISIRLLQAYPNLTSTIIDFPNVAEIGSEYIAEAGLSERIRYLKGNALETMWPTKQDAILMSYLCSGIPGVEVPRVINYAFDCLAPGGTIVIHDFMVEDGRDGPPLAALWQLQHMAFTPEALSLTPGWLGVELKRAGFINIDENDMIPGMTRVVHAIKPLND